MRVWENVKQGQEAEAFQRAVTSFFIHVADPGLVHTPGGRHCANGHNHATHHKPVAGLFLVSESCILGLPPMHPGRPLSRNLCSITANGGPLHAKLRHASTWDFDKADNDELSFFFFVSFFFFPCPMSPQKTRLFLSLSPPLTLCNRVAYRRMPGMEC